MGEGKNEGEMETEAETIGREKRERRGKERMERGGREESR